MDSFMKLYEVSNKIIDCYIELVCIDDDIDVNFYQMKIDTIKKLVLEEYSMIRSMSYDQFNEWMEIVDSDSDDAALARLRNKIIDYKEFADNKIISAKELDIKDVPDNVMFSIYDAMLSMFNLDLVKKLKNKIYSLEGFVDSDYEFILALKQEFKHSLITLLFSLSATEFITLYSNNDISLLPDIELYKLKRKSDNLDNFDFNGVMDTILTYYIKKLIDTLADISIVNNSPKGVFNFLVSITQLEVLLSFMNDKLYISAFNYCYTSNYENKAIMNYTKKLIKNSKKD